MGWFNEDSYQAQAYDQVINKPYDASTWTLELIAGAVSYVAAKAYEDQVRERGRLPPHAQAKEILSAASAQFIDRELQMHDLGSIDKEEAKRQAKQQAEDALNKYKGINPKKIVSGAQFEKEVTADLQEENGSVIVETPESDQRIMEELLEAPRGAFGKSFVKLDNDSASCANCGRHYSYLEVVNEGLRLHSKQFLKDVMIGRYGHVFNPHAYVQGEGPRCCTCDTPAAKNPYAYSQSTYHWHGE